MTASNSSLNWTADITMNEFQELASALGNRCEGLPSILPFNVTIAVAFASEDRHVIDKCSQQSRRTWSAIGLSTVRSTGGIGLGLTTKRQSCTGPVQKSCSIAQATAKQKY